MKKMEKWRDGETGKWRNGNREMERWRNGEMEEWRKGRLDGDKNGVEMEMEKMKINKMRENWNRERQKWRKWSGEKIGSWDEDWRKRDWGGEKNRGEMKMEKTSSWLQKYHRNNKCPHVQQCAEKEPFGGFRWNFWRTQSQVRGSFATTWIRAAPITRSTRWCSRWSQQSTRRTTARFRTKLIE